MKKLGFVVTTSLAVALAANIVPAETLSKVFGEGYFRAVPFSGLSKEEYLAKQAYYFDQADENGDGRLTHQENEVLEAKLTGNMPASLRHEIVNSLRALRGADPLPPLGGEPRFRYHLTEREQAAASWKPGAFAFALGKSE